MNFSKFFICKTVCFIVFFAAAPLASLRAQNLRPFSKARSITTEHFEFIFPDESEPTARFLAGRADAIYDRLSDFLGVKLSGRVPVSITPHTGEVNGYMNPVPYSHILLFDTPQFPDFANFENTVESLFIHELVHAICAGSKSPAMGFLQNIFGAWPNLLLFNAPWFMVEGAAVALESEKKFGRTNDPLVKGRLRQDVIENVFKTPFQAEGAWDLPPGGQVYYDYGGLFFAYLIRVYGAQKFRELWKDAGAVFHFSINKYNNGFYYIFKNIYNKKLTEVWDDFKNDIKLENEISTDIKIVYKSERKHSKIIGVVSKNENIYFIDSYAQRILVYNTLTQQTKTVVSLDESAYSIDISPDGKRLLVSNYIRWGANSGQLSQPAAVEYHVKSGLPTGRVFKDIYYARYFKDGILGIASSTHRTNIVYRPFSSKNEELLIKGPEGFIFGDISPIDENRFAFICIENGRREISIFDYGLKKARSFTFLQPRDELNAGSFWNYVRDLNFSEGKLLFQYENSEGMPKLGEIDLGEGGPSGAGTAFFYADEFSGGVHSPVKSGGRVFHKSAFSATDALSLYSASFAAVEEGVSAKTAFSAALSLKDWSAERNSLCALSPKAEPPMAFAGPSFKDFSKGDAAIQNWEPYHDIISMPFVNFTLEKINPFNLWVPLLYFNQESKTGFSGAGGFFYIADPLDSNIIFLEAYYDWDYNMAPVHLTWTNFSFGFPIYFYYDDYALALEYYAERISQTSLYAYFKFPILTNRLTFSFQPGLSVSHLYLSRYSENPVNVENVKSNSAYDWKENTKGYFLNIAFILSTMDAWSWEIFGNGFSQAFYLHTWLKKDLNPGLENVITVAAEPLPFIHISGVKQTLYASYWDNYLKNVQGDSIMASTNFKDASLNEYSMKIPQKMKWILGGQTEIKLFSFNIQKNITHLYFNRVYMTLAYRWAYWGGQLEGEYPQYLHSALLNLALKNTIIPAALVPLKIVPSVWASLKISALNGGIEESPLAFGFKFSYSY
ncbi:MAG: hypothetical protein LBC53_06735 [Spirochaetaceae bacterium]|nr:hypothetical protein [Spirochaetaceae bacterium]